MKSAYPTTTPSRGQDTSSPMSTHIALNRTSWLPDLASSFRGCLDSLFLFNISIWNEKYARNEGHSQALGVVSSYQKAGDPIIRVLISIDKEIIVI